MPKFTLENGSTLHLVGVGAKRISTENTYLDAENTMSEKVSLSDKVKVKSVILFVGDGMGIFTLGIGTE